MKLKYIVPCAICFLLTEQIRAQDLSGMANAFLETLSGELKADAFFPFQDDERYNMNYVPLERKGPTFHDFNPSQKEAALALLRASLSEQGYEKTMEIRKLESILRVIEADENDLMPDGKHRRDPQRYHFCIFGAPSPTELWGWRFEGHHVSLNFTSDTGEIVSATPAFWGSNPGIVKTGEHKGKQVLKKESEMGLSLVNSLTEAQLKTAKFTDKAPYEIYSSNQRQVPDMEKRGIPYSELNEEQQQGLRELLNLYIANYAEDFSEDFKEKIMAAGIENLSFAWAGALREGEAYYYSIQGPTLLIELDNSQNDANHVHTAIRDLTNDYGADILRKHYEEEHH